MFLKEINPEKPIVFLHIPRSAGSSFRWIAASQYGNEKIYLVRDDYCTEKEAIDRQSEFKMITGHIPIDSNVVENLHGDYNFITILRHPLFRFLSWHHYAHNWKGEGGEHEEVKEMSLKEVILCPSVRYHNQLCRYLGGFNTNTMYVEALETIKNKLTLFGFYEYYPEMLAIMQRRFGWNGLVIKREEYLPGGLLPDQLSKELCDELIEQNRMDMDLYGYAVSLYEERRLKWLE